jgi:hypothetical protein
VADEISKSGAGASTFSDWWAYKLEAWDAIHSFFDGTCDGDQHLVDGHHAVVHADDDARKIRVREDGDGNRKG